MSNLLIKENIFSKKDGRITAEFAPIFQMLTQPAEDVKALYKQQKIRGAETLTDFLSVISNRIQKFFGCGWSNDLLVLVMGLEPIRHFWQQILSLPRLPFQHTSILDYGTHFWVVN